MIDSNNDFIHTFQLEDTNICDELITYFHNNNEYKNHGKVGEGEIKPNVKDSLDLKIYPSSTNKTIQNYYKNLQVGLTDYVHKFKMQDCKLHTIEPMNIQHYKPGGGFKEWHFERDNANLGSVTRVLAFMTYLNDVKDGGTEWYWQNIKTEAVKGLSVIWPTEFTHRHRGIVSHTQDKYIITGWINLI